MVRQKLPNLHDLLRSHTCADAIKPKRWQVGRKTAQQSRLTAKYCAVAGYLSVLALCQNNAQLVPEVGVTGLQLHSHRLDMRAINEAAICYALQLLLVGVLIGCDNILLGDAS